LLPVVLAVMAVDEKDKTLGAARHLDLMERCDALRKPERFLDLIAAAACVRDVDQAAWQARVAAVRSIDAGAIARAQQGDTARIKQAVREARLQQLQAGASDAI